MNLEQFLKKRGFKTLDDMLKYYSKILSYENQGNVYQILKDLFKNE